MSVPLLWMTALVLVVVLIVIILVALVSVLVVVAILRIAALVIIIIVAPNHSISIRRIVDGIVVNILVIVVGFLSRSGCSMYLAFILLILVIIALAVLVVRLAICVVGFVVVATLRRRRMA